MDFALNDEQLEFKALCRRFATEVIRPVAPQHDADESSPGRSSRRPASGASRRRAHAARRRRPRRPARRHLRRGDPLGLRRDRARDLRLDARRRRPRRVRHARADRRSGCPSASAPATRSSSAPTPSPSPRPAPTCKTLRTTAKRDGDEWVLNGTKVFITNGGIADVHVVVATVDPELGHRGQASFVIGKDTPGLRQGKKETKLGIRASHTAEVILEDCRIPVENLLGGMDKLERKLERARSGQSSGRASNALATFELTRPVVGASALGIAQAAYEWTLEYLGQRRPVDPIGLGARRELDRRQAAARAPGASSRSSPTSRPRSRPPACSSSAPRGWAAPASR